MSNTTSSAASSKSEMLKKILDSPEFQSIQNELIREEERKREELGEEKYVKEKIKTIVDPYIFRCFLNKRDSEKGVSLLLKLYKDVAGAQVNEKVVEILQSFEYCDGDLMDKELNFLRQHFEETVNFIFSTNSFNHQLLGGFIQPKEVTDYICHVASFPKDVVVYNPFARTNSYALDLSNKIEGEEIDPKIWAVGQIRLFANNRLNNTEIKLRDSFKAIREEKKYKAIITSPIHSKERGKDIANIVSELYNKLEEGGKIVCLVETSFLFSENNNNKEIREHLIAERAIEKVITLPSNIFSGTSVSQSVLVLTKDAKKKRLLLADATGFTRYEKSIYRDTTFDWELFKDDLKVEIDDYYDRGEYIDDSTIGAEIEYSELISSNLTPALYLTPKPENGIPLSDLVEEVKELRGEDFSAEYFVTGSSIPVNMHREPFQPQKVKERKVATAKKHVQVPEESVILALVSGNVRTVYTDGFTGKVAFPDGFLKFLKPKDGISARYLAALISTEQVSKQIKAQTIGLTIPRLNRVNLSQVIVPNHQTLEEREQLVSDVLSQEMSKLESELQQTVEKQKREIRSTRHAMIQTLSALSSNWEQLKMFSEIKGEGICLSDTIGKINPISVKDLMGSIGYAISTLQRQVESLRFEKTDWGQDVAIDPYTFINDYIATHSSPSVRMINVGHNNEADRPYIDDETGETKVQHTEAADIFYAPERLLERIFNNIVANAKAHGFSSERINNEIRFDWKPENDGIVITISNNGLPLKEGVTGNDVLMSGFTTALNQNAEDGTLHSGQGGFEIKSLMEGIGTVEVESHPNAEFPVIYKLTFEKTNYETFSFEED